MGMIYSDELLSTSDVASRLNVSERTVQSWIAGGLLPARKVGGVHIIFAQDLASFEPPKKGRPPRIKTYHSDVLGAVTIPED
jgi:excisionase family DNA binding protein